MKKRIKALGRWLATPPKAGSRWEGLFWGWVWIETRIRTAFLTEAQKKRDMDDLLSGHFRR